MLTGPNITFISVKVKAELESVAKLKTHEGGLAPPGFNCPNFEINADPGYTYRIMADKIHVLLVDDDPIMLQLFGGQLAANGFELLYGHDGAEGWEMARRMKPQIILLDYRMPSMDGIETATHLKGEDATKDIPIIMLTSEDFWPDTVKTLKEIGVSGYIHKGRPFRDLLAEIAKALQEKGIVYEPPK